MIYASVKLTLSKQKEEKGRIIVKWQSVYIRQQSIFILGFSFNINSSSSSLRICDVLLKIQKPLLQVFLQVFCKLTHAKKGGGCIVKKTFWWFMIRNLLQHFSEFKILFNTVFQWQRTELDLVYLDIIWGMDKFYTVNTKFTQVFMYLGMILLFYFLLLNFWNPLHCCNA